MITREFADKLHAKNRKSEILKIVGCGNLSTGIQSYPVVPAGIQCRDGTFTQIEAVVVPKIMCDVSQAEFTPQVKEYFSKYELVNPETLNPHTDSIY